MHAKPSLLSHCAPRITLLLGVAALATGCGSVVVIGPNGNGNDAGPAVDAVVAPDVQPARDVPPIPADRVVVRTCTRGSDCRPGEACTGGEGCGIPWTCGPALGRPCTDDLAPFCGCDGATFRGSSSCPERPFRMRGPCEAPPPPGCPTTAVSLANGCYTEEGCASLCPRGRYHGDPMVPSWRVTGIQVTAPAALASPLIQGVLNPPLRDGRFLWGLSFDLGSNTFRTGALNQMFTRGSTGQGLMDGAFAYYNDNAPFTGERARWNPGSGSLRRGAGLSSTTLSAPLRLPIFNDDRSLLLELPIHDAMFFEVPLSDDRGCIGLGRLRAGRFNECGSEWDTAAGGTLQGAITVSSARGITISALNQTLCQLLAGTPCDQPMNSWMRRPDTMAGAEPAWRFSARFAAIAANIP